MSGVLDSTGTPGDDCDCRSQTAPGVPGGETVVLLALLGLLRRGMSSLR
ncbi:hypothetical protein H8E07_19130 [bacterium]|nr:hypothetical protein [bacterium]